MPGIFQDEAIYRGYCPLGEPEVAIHATDLLYDIALPSTFLRRLVALSPSFSFLRTLLALTLIPLRSFIFAIMASCIFFSLRHRREAKVYFILRLMATTTGSLILRRLIRHESPHPPRLYWISREDLHENYLFNALGNRGCYRVFISIYVIISTPAGPRFSPSQVSQHFEPRISTTNAPH